VREIAKMSLDIAGTEITQQSHRGRA